MIAHRFLPLLAASLGAFLLSSPAHANPEGGQVQAGQATISGQGTANVQVHQSTDKAVIDWRTFNIAPGETTQFFQPSAASITLNRVTGGLGRSTIDGVLKANGNIFIVNPDGILFGKNSVVDVGGLVATTHDIKTDDFMAGRMKFDVPGKPDASVVAEGQITVREGGFAALVAPGVRNEGVIGARLGRVGLSAAGSGFTLDLYGDGLINLFVGDSIAGAVKDVRTGETLDALVKNTGRISADGGRVALTAAEARRVVDSVVNNTGIIEANTVGTRGGEIVLGAATTRGATSPAQTVKVSGTLRAAGRDAGTTGGRIKIVGEEIAVAGATLDASGEAGGGRVLIGGDRQGGQARAYAPNHAMAAFESEIVPTAARVTIEPTVTIDVSAKGRGNGGKAIVWSDVYTRYGGSIFAGGGPRGGDGGFVEVSSKGALIAGGTVDVSSPLGRAGLFLLDPVRTYVVSSNSPCLVNPLGCDPTGTSSYLNVDLLASTTNVVLVATELAQFDAALTLAAGTQANPSTILAQADSIVVNMPITADHVVLSAPSSIALNALVTGRESVELMYSDGGAKSLSVLLAGIQLSNIFSPGLGLSLPNGSLRVDVDLDGSVNDPLRNFRMVGLGGQSLEIPAGRLLLRPIANNPATNSGFVLWAGTGGMTIGTGSTVEADLISLELGNASGLQFAGSVLRGRHIDIWKSSTVPGDITIGGTIDLLASPGDASTLAISNENGSLAFDATLNQPANAATLIAMEATGNLNIARPLNVQGGMLLYAGGTLNSYYDITISNIVVPATVSFPLMAPFVNQSALVMVGSNLTGNENLPPGIQITRQDPAIGAIAVIRQNGMAVDAYLDGFTSGQVESFFAARAAEWGSPANPYPFGLNGPITGTLSANDLQTSGRILVPAALTGGNPLNIFVVASLPTCNVQGNYCFDGQNAYVTAADVGANLNALTATSTITFQAPVNAGTNTITVSAPSINIQAPISAGTLEFASTVETAIAANITVTTALVFNGAGTVTGSGERTLNANAGTVTFNSEVAFNGGLEVIGGTITVNSQVAATNLSLIASGTTGVVINPGKVLQGESVSIRLDGLNAGFVNQGTIRGREIEIGRFLPAMTYPGSALTVGGTIQLLANPGDLGRLNIFNAHGDVHYNAALVQPPGSPTLVAIEASGNLNINSPIIIQGGLLLYAGQTLALNSAIHFSDVAIPDGTGTPIDGQSMLIAIGRTLQGANPNRTEITRDDPGIGLLAMVEQTSLSEINAYLDGPDAEGFETFMANRVADRSAPYVQWPFALAGPITGEFTSLDMYVRGIDVPPPFWFAYLPDDFDFQEFLNWWVLHEILYSQEFQNFAGEVGLDNALDALDRALDDIDRPGDGPADGPLADQTAPDGRPLAQYVAQFGTPIPSGALPPMPRTFDVPKLDERRFVQDEVLVKVAGNLTPEQIAAIERRFGLTRLGGDSFAFANLAFGRYRIPPGQNIREVIQALSGDRNVDVGQPNYTFSLTEDAAEQTETLPASVPIRALPQAQQQQMQFSVEQLRLREAHRIARGDAVTIAVIDSTIDAEHPELKGSLSKTLDATGVGAGDPHEHGTGMAGAIVSRATLTGTAPRANVVGITAFRPDGRSAQGTTISILRALDMAYREGAKVVNMSFAGPRDPLLARALAEARARGMVLVAASGNAGPKSPPLFPAADPNVIAVTAVDANDRIFDMAVRGNHVTVAAPGVDVLVPAPNNGYEFSTGTSVAAAHVSGLVALILERNPNASAEEIRVALAQSARDQGRAGRDTDYGNGVADAYGALQAMDQRLANTATGATAQPPAAPTPRRAARAAPGGGGNGATVLMSAPRPR